MEKKVIKRSKTIDRWKTKKWYTLIAPKMFNMIELGETPAQKHVHLENRPIRKPVDQLTGNRKMRHVTVIFKVKDIQEQKAYTKLTGHVIKKAYIQRMVRRRKSKIDAIVTLYTKANEKVRITATTICAKKITRTEETEIRKAMEQEIMALGKNKSYEDFAQDMIFGALSSNIFKKAKEIAKIKRIEIIKSRLLEG